jgi:hypothetical protein
MKFDYQVRAFLHVSVISTITHTCIRSLNFSLENQRYSSIIYELHAKGLYNISLVIHVSRTAFGILIFNSDITKINTILIKNFFYTCWATSLFFSVLCLHADRFWNTIDWLIIYCFTSHLKIFHLFLYGNVTITSEGLWNLSLCLALRAFEQRVIFIVPHPLRLGASVFSVSSEGLPHSVAFYDIQRDVEDLL